MRSSGGKGNSGPQAPSPTVAWTAAAMLLVLAICVAVLCLFKINDYDVWWHLKTGQWILDHKAIPRVDPFSYTIIGKPWITFEWLSQVVFYALHAAAGPAGLIFFKTSLVLATFGCLVLYPLAPDSGKTARFPAGVLAVLLPLWVLTACGARAIFFERPQLFTYFFTALYLVFLKRGERRPWLHWTLPAFQILWANFHGGASIIGLVLIGAWWLGSLPFLPKPGNRNIEPGSSKRLGWVFGACVLASLANPHGFALYTHLTGTLAFKGREAISEWAPLSFDRKLWPLWVPLLALELFSAIAWISNPNRRWGDALLLLAFFFFSFRAIRFAAQSLLVFGQIAGGNWGERPVSQPMSPKGAFRAAAFSVLLSAFLTWGYVSYAFPGVYSPGLGVAHDARDAISHLQRSGLKGNLFNSYELGGQLIWRAPEHPVFVDGRNVEYGSEFVWKAMRWFRPEVWRELDGLWRFQIAVIQNGSFYLCRVLDDDPAWSLVYWDDEALVYARRDGPNASIAKEGYRTLRPNEIGFGYLDQILFREPLQVAQVLAEVEKAVRQSPGHINPRLTKAYVCRRLGRPGDALPDIEEARRLAPERVEPAYELALTLQSLGRNDDAASLYEESIRLAVRSGNRDIRVQALNNLAVIRYRSGDKEKAVSLWREALRVDPVNREASHNLEVTLSGSPG